MKQNHRECELFTPLPPGTYGGKICRCGCHGDHNWNKVNMIEKEIVFDEDKTRTLTDILKDLDDWEERSRESLLKNPITVK